MDPSIGAAASAAIESAINRALRYDPASRARLQKLAGKVLGVELTAPRGTWYCVFSDGEQVVTVHNHWEGAVTTRLTGSATALLRLLREDGATAPKLGISVMGSTALLAELQAALGDLDIDWEEALAESLGDVPAHTIGQALRSAGAWLGGIASRGPRHMAEAATEEWRVSPPRAQFEAFVDDLADTSLALDRLAARVELLRSKMAARRDG
ncbi:ubiquinone biosynthesis accessory factor UbiJ [Biformimicrobium ophioploci]|uniref:Ubiquinone biosynthesis accessory factor UbiJ n=1 Tax=Biformimicrobium ophioploci TaxID=3036711 RepID=A0ABQ6LVU4_9GAMM|nr:SCP2 sterol-binding domain-containing protein [Microbulbifer sp. NKW57]GMG86214.1 SCP2 sterol-binding domain-containing protein [Microbulbifer sp. NKW57]